MHPRLNFEQFQKERKQRQKRRALLWIVGITSAILLVAALSKAGTLHSLSFSQKSDGATQLHQEPAEREEYRAVLEQNDNCADELATSFMEIVSDELRTTEWTRVMGSNPFDAMNVAAMKVTAMDQSADRGQDDLGRSSVVVEAETERVVEVQEGEEEPMDVLATEIGAGSENKKLATKERKRKQPFMGFSMQWLPMHSAVLCGNDDGSYRSLNSGSIGVQIPVAERHGVRVLIAPSYQVNRYQFQYEYSWQGRKYAPGSIIGYRETGTGYEPILSDSISGTFTRNVRSNGQVAEAFLPLVAEWTLVARGPWRVEVNTAAGLRVRTGASGNWSDETGIRPLADILGTKANFSPYVSAASEASVHLNYVQLFVRGESRYIQTMNAAEERARFQVGLGLRAQF